MNKGKIISIVGGPRAGKSYLVNKLADHYGAIPLLEEAGGDFPARIKEDIAGNIRALERITWFRNKQVRDFLEADKLRKDSKTVITDNFWISYQLYIDTLAKDFEQEIIKEIAEIDKQTLPWPDVIVLLTLSEPGLRKFITAGGREFDKSEDFITSQALPVHKMHQSFFESLKTTHPIIILNRDELDFSKQEDLQVLTDQIDRLL